MPLTGGYPVLVFRRRLDNELLSFLLALHPPQLPPSSPQPRPRIPCPNSLGNKPGLITNPDPEGAAPSTGLKYHFLSFFFFLEVDTDHSYLYLKLSHFVHHEFFALTLIFETVLLW